MKVIITGGDEYRLKPGDWWFLEKKAQEIGLKEIYTDGRRGVAAQIEAWARQQRIPVHRVRADFVAEGNAPFPRRNAMLVSLGDAVIAFPGSVDVTTDLIAKARAKKMSIHESPSRQLRNMGLVQDGPKQTSPPKGIRLTP